MMFDRCPGAANIRTPTLTVKKCPQCGEEVEVFSNDISVKCPKCGFTVFNDITSCIQSCRYARECIGDELFETLVKKNRQ